MEVCTLYNTVVRKAEKGNMEKCCLKMCNIGKKVRAVEAGGQLPRADGLRHFAQCSDGDRPFEMDTCTFCTLVHFEHFEHFEHFAHLKCTLAHFTHLYNAQRKTLHSTTMLPTYSGPCPPK